LDNTLLDARREVEMKLRELLAQLERMPDEVREAAAALGETRCRVAPAGGGFCLVEQAWHLADLEREGFGVRLDRLLHEPDPFLPNFDGARIAAERDYKSKSLHEGIAAFAAARAANIALLRSLAPHSSERSGMQENVGRIAVSDIPRMMLEHDDSHRAEIAALTAAAADTGAPGRPPS
jgi:hypothetical protein